MRKAVPALATVFALALLWAPSTFAHGRDYYDDDDQGEYDDQQGYDDGSCDYDHCGHAAAIPRFDELNGYGEWRYVPAFGTHLWFPWVSVTWRPYYYGHWVRTSFGMTWVSYEPWGDIPHHYGSWVYTDPWGWGWVPGWQYSPAWVTWSVVDGYVGWAPCPPAGYRYPNACRYRPSSYVRQYGYSDPCGYPDSGLDFSLWIFVSNRDFCDRQVYEHALPSQNCLSLFKTKRVLPVGPRLDVNYVQRFSPGKFRPVSMDRRYKQVGGRSIELYEPRGQRDYVINGRQASQGTWGKVPRSDNDRRDAWHRMPGNGMNGRVVNGRDGRVRDADNGRDARDVRDARDTRDSRDRDSRGEAPERVKPRRDDSRDDQKARSDDQRQNRDEQKAQNDDQRQNRDEKAERSEHSKSKSRSKDDPKADRSDQDQKKQKG